MEVCEFISGVVVNQKTKIVLKYMAISGNIVCCTSWWRLRRNYSIDPTSIVTLMFKFNLSSYLWHLTQSGTKYKASGYKESNEVNKYIFMYIQEHNLLTNADMF